MANPDPQEAEPAPQSKRFSRYRSVRKANKEQQQEEEAPPVPATDVEKDPEIVARRMSRYHRNRPATAVAPPSEKLPNTPSHVYTQQVSSDDPQDQLAARTRAQSTSKQQSAHKTSPDSSPPAQISSKTAARHGDLRHSQQDGGQVSARAEARQLLANEAETQERMRVKQRAERQARLDAEQAERHRQQREADEA
ncbi:hypothetical protein LTS18_011386, partial [Coniosporium uncinatum]